ncbi:kinase [Bifidobacterium margollesii]|uniref:non-specific serine/threonine protein kinase n=1 Tax=Bifidobacterium margollesii TaxID=2020964 RepID=A0A2N5JD09_9BIFI|nr:serine/threonine-protein kinase [Bifidobacterium margollesii]PLS32065.1 kinase [Bifidobacterium margollesii]
MTVEPPQLPGYDHVRTLASGADSTVFLYRQREPDRLVAVKVTSRLSDSRARMRLRTETGFMADLSTHPHIPALYDSGITDDGRGYLVMDYAAGGSYKEFIRFSLLTADQALTVGIEIAGALFFAHVKGIIHRDIKPSNILLGERGTPLLTDFGIAASIYSAKRAEGFSTPWAAPEVLSGESGGSEAADIYSLGATLYALLAGHSPFEYGYRVADDRELAEAIIHRDLPKLRRDDVPEALEQVLAQAMSRRPEDRYPSALLFARAMQRVQQRCYGHQTPVIAAHTPPYDEHAPATLPATPAPLPPTPPSLRRQQNKRPSGGGTYW